MCYWVLNQILGHSDQELLAVVSKTNFFVEACAVKLDSYYLGKETSGEPLCLGPDYFLMVVVERRQKE